MAGFRLLRRARAHLLGIGAFTADSLEHQSRGTHRDPFGRANRARQHWTPGFHAMLAGGDDEMTQFKGLCLVLWVGGLLTLPIGCSSSDSGGCEDTGSGAGYCYCASGNSCSETCADGQGACSLDCANRNKNCSLTGFDECDASCQGAVSCTVDCRDDASIACQATGKCTVKAGNNATIDCDMAQDCEITCEGSCSVPCRGGHCRVTCADPVTCDLQCAKQGTEPMLCPDGQTKTCDAPC
jgi:hypothetical protein